MTDQLDIKKYTMDELYRRLQTIEKNLGLERMRQAPNQDTIELFEFYKWTILQELNERFSIANSSKPLNKNLTNDALSEKEHKEENDNWPNGKPRK